uniref:Transposase-associated domain-containing protein n=1 Tax=Setaria italica TaxID=4555 RepID=K3ZEA0_SETIT
MDVSKVVEAVKKHARICKTKQIRYPCFDCSNNIVWEDTDVIKRHLIKGGFTGGTFNNTDIENDEVGGDDANKNDHDMMDDDYDHGDQNGDQTHARLEPQVDEKCDVDMEDMLHHIESKVLLGSAKWLEKFETLKKVAKDRMYVGCGKEWIVKFGWSDNSFNDLVTLLGNLLPKPNIVLKNTYEAKKIINPLYMRVQRIYACRNHCILYRGQYAGL